MKTIALLTDFGLSDNYVGVIKGVILNINPKVNIVDIAHNISSFNIFEGAFILRASYKYFPKGTIFLCVVDPGVGSARKPIAIKTKNYYFVGPDNGVLSLAAKEDGIKEIIVLKNTSYFLKNRSFTFHARDIFAPIAARITKGFLLAVFGKRINTINEIKIPKPIIKNNSIIAEIIYIDKFGNLITNLTKDEFNKFIGKEKWAIKIGSKIIEDICNFYEQALANKPFLIEGSSDFLEISLKNSSAYKYLFP